MSQQNSAYTNRPEWMNDELVKNIPQSKLDFLGKMFAQSQGKTQKEMMTFLMPAMQQAKKENLTFSAQEMSAAIAAIRKHSNPEELSKIDNILAKTKQGSPS